MKITRLIVVLALFVCSLNSGWVPSAHAFGFSGCGTMCISQMQGFCPTCNAMANYQNTMPWGTPAPYWWQSGPMMYPNFYSPAPFVMPQYQPNYYPGVQGNYYPGGGGVFAAKPNLYIDGAPGTKVRVMIQMKEEGANWLAAVPTHGTDGWYGVLTDKKRIETTNGAYRYLYSDYRLNGLNFQDSEGFCADRRDVINKMALQLNHAGFSGREIADFLEYWSVKLPKSDHYCVYPQDERQMNVVAPIEATPKPASVRRLLFLVQVQEGLVGGGRKFAAAPKRIWNPQPLRVPAAVTKNSITIREWGVGFLAAEKRSK